MALDVSDSRYPGSAYDERWRRLVLTNTHPAPTPRARYHLVVLGAGPAGLVTAMAAAKLGADVALLEKNAMGGDCLNVGCIPSKALLEFTRANVGADDFDAAFEWMRRTRASIAEHDSVERFTQAGVDVFSGAGKFLDENTVQVGSLRLRTHRSVIATGSRPHLPPIAGLAEVRPQTTETIFALKRRPTRLAIIGAGAVGCELGQVFAKLGVGVVLLETADRVLASEDPRASDQVAAALRALGVEIRLGVTGTQVTRRGTHVHITIDGQQPADIAVDELLVATGRAANTDELNLAAVGVETEPNGRIVVDRYLRTTNARIYAAGDVCSAGSLTHGADAHARIVVQNALFAPTATTTKLVIPRCTYTDPEVAQIGPTGEQLRRGGTRFDTYHVDWKELDRGRARGDEGFAEVLTAAGSGEIIAATIVGRDAGEQIAPIAIAIANRLDLGALGKAVLPYPTRAEFMRKMADRYRSTQLTPRRARLLKTWLKLRR